MIDARISLTEFLLARIAEDEAAGDFSDSDARQARTIVRCAELRLYAGAEYHVRELASRYADHPDYDEAWRP